MIFFIFLFFSAGLKPLNWRSLLPIGITLVAAGILMLTSISRETGMDFTPRTEEDLKKLRVDDFHSKPIKPRLLLEKVETLLRRRAEKEEG